MFKEDPISLWISATVLDFCWQLHFNLEEPGGCVSGEQRVGAHMGISGGLMSGESKEYASLARDSPICLQTLMQHLQELLTSRQQWTIFRHHFFPP